MAKRGTFYHGTKSATSSNQTSKNPTHFSGVKPLVKRAPSASVKRGGSQRRDSHGRFA